MQTVTTESETAANENQVTRLRKFARGERGGCLHLEVYRTRIAVIVAWNVNRGDGWRAKRWTKRFGGASAEADAAVFASGKWAQLIAWLETLEPKQGQSAVDAFSAQVATMG